MTTTTRDLTRADRITILKLLAEGRDLDFAATATGHSAEQVRMVATSHGYPDPQKLRWAIDVLTEQADDDIPPAEHTTAHDLTGARVRPAANAGPRAAARPGTTPAPRPTPTAKAAPTPAPTKITVLSDADRLIALGRKSTRARTRTLAERAAKALDLLTKEVHAEEERKREAARRAAEEARVRSEIERLEAELAAKRALLPKHKAAVKGMTTAASAGVNPKTVRAWARENDIECPAAGRLPRRVVDAYLAATQGAA